MSKHNAIVLKGKISVTHYLNDRLASMGNGKDNAYPVYVKIIFNRKVTQIKSEFGKFVSQTIPSGIDAYLTEKEFKKLNNVQKKGMDSEKAHIIGIIDLFRNNGVDILGKDTKFILSHCLISTQEVVMQYLKNKLFTSLYSDIDKERKIYHLIDWDDIRLSFKEMYEGLEYWNIYGKEIRHLFHKSYALILSDSFQISLKKAPFAYQWINIELQEQSLIVSAINNHFLVINAKLQKPLIVLDTSDPTKNVLALNPKYKSLQYDYLKKD